MSSPQKGSSLPGWWWNTNAWYNLGFTEWFYRSVLANCKSLFIYFFFQMTISMKEGLSSASSSLYHWIDLRVWILLEKTVLCFLDSSVLCCGTYLWFVQGPLVALWVFQSMRKLDLVLLIHLVWRLGGCFCHPDPSLYLCGCDSYSAGKLCLVSISRNCSRYWWVRNLNHWLIHPLLLLFSC